MLRTKHTTRSGFTLVELMIAAATTVLIMSILSICFQTAMKAMSSMRAQGDAADQLRSLSAVMKRDFNADRHLESEGSSQVVNRGRRLSDYRFQSGAASPGTGFFYLESPPSTYEGYDGVFDSYRNAGTRVWFTSVLPGGNEGDLFTANVGGTVYSSEAAEVAYFLLPAGQTSGSPSLPLYNLYRRQRLVALDSGKQSLFPMDPEVISLAQPGAPPTWYVNTMSSIAAGGRNASIFTPLSGSRTGDDIILSNVISFEVKPTWEPGAITPTPPRPMGNSTVAVDTSDTYNALTNKNSSDWPFDSLSAFPLAGYQFDSLFTNPNHPRVRVNALQLRIRIYDSKVKTARQISMIQDL